MISLSRNNKWHTLYESNKLSIWDRHAIWNSDYSDQSDDEMNDASGVDESISECASAKEHLPNIRCHDIRDYFLPREITHNSNTLNAAGNTTTQIHRKKLIEMPSEIHQLISHFLMLSDLLSLEVTSKYFNQHCKKPTSCYFIDFTNDHNIADLSHIRFSQIKELSLVTDCGDSFDFNTNSIHPNVLKHLDVLYLDVWHQDLLYSFHDMEFASLKHVYIVPTLRFYLQFMHNFMSSHLETLMMPFKEDGFDYVIAKDILASPNLNNLQIHCETPSSKRADLETKKLLSELVSNEVQYKYECIQLIESSQCDHYSRVVDVSVYTLLGHLISHNQTVLTHLSLEWIPWTVTYGRGDLATTTDSCNTTYLEMISLGIDELLCYDTLVKINELKLSGDSHGIVFSLKRIDSIISGSKRRVGIALTKIVIEVDKKSPVLSYDEMQIYMHRLQPNNIYIPSVSDGECQLSTN
eukprot:130376_1